MKMKNCNAFNHNYWETFSDSKSTYLSSYSSELGYLWHQVLFPPLTTSLAVHQNARCFHKQRQAEIDKNQASAKQPPETELQYLTVIYILHHVIIQKQ